MRTRKPKPDPDIEPEYDFHGAGLNPYAERYREAERHGRIRYPGSAPVPSERPDGDRGVETAGLLTRWRDLHPVDPVQLRADVDSVVDQSLDQDPASRRGRGPRQFDPS